MTVGTVSSQQNAAAAVAARPSAAAASNAPAVPQQVQDQQSQEPILRSGEKLASTAQALSNPDAKVFYHQVAGAKFIMPDGLELVFMGGRLVTDDPVIIKELGKVANRSTSLIYTTKDGVLGATAAEHQLAVDAATNAHQKQ